jgi:alkyldihydroxyacetonephosphate synthase
MERLAQSEIIGGLVALLGEDSVSTSAPDVVAMSADFWPRTQLWKMGGEVERFPPDCIAWPRTEAEVSTVVRFCAEKSIPIVPYGGGSGVCGGTVPIYGGVVLDLKRLEGEVEIDASSLTATAHSGINGQHLEDRLNAAGVTLGHFPSSIMCSTLGGWLATRSAGQYSSCYGKIEDMVLDLRAVLPSGEIVDTSDRQPGDPDWTQVLVGSEGTLGIITSARLRVHPQPTQQWLRGYRFHHLHDGLEAMRLVMQAGLRPMVFRLYDPLDTFIAMNTAKKRAKQEERGALIDILSPGDGSDGPPGVAKRLLKGAARMGISRGLAIPAALNKIAQVLPSNCKLIIGFEGPEETVRIQSDRAAKLLRSEGGEDMGAGPGVHWLENRYAVSFKQSRLYQAGAFVDTMEVATTWDRLEALYREVREAVSPHAFVMAHFSHAYREGCSIYFTFAASRSRPDRAEALYDRIWKSALTAVHGVGASASHHHGVGLLKRDAMVEEHGQMLRVWRVLKDTLDPKGIMNPGKLFPDGAGGA